jgi:hypothetical protein
LSHRGPRWAAHKVPARPAAATNRAASSTGRGRETRRRSPGPPAVGLP